MSLTDEGQHVMLTQGIQFDVAHDDHFIVLRLE